MIGETFYKGDEGFGTLDGLRFDCELGQNGEKAGQNGADGNYVEQRAHIIATTKTLIERWLCAHNMVGQEYQEPAAADRLGTSR